MKEKTTHEEEEHKLMLNFFYDVAKDVWYIVGDVSWFSLVVILVPLVIANSTAIVTWGLIKTIIDFMRTVGNKRPRRESAEPENQVLSLNELRAEKKRRDAFFEMFSEIAVLVLIIASIMVPAWMILLKIYIQISTSL